VAKHYFDEHINTPSEFGDGSLYSAYSTQSDWQVVGAKQCGMKLTRGIGINRSRTSCKEVKNNARAARCHLREKAGKELFMVSTLHDR
jgi:hypothetical protein